VFASGGDDNQIAIWDLAVERDTANDPDDIKVCLGFCFHLTNYKLCLIQNK